MISIYEMLETSACKYPDKKAFIEKERAVSFSEMESFSSCLAGHLKAFGIEPGQRVGIFSPKCLEEIVVLFAIMKIGAVIVHINPGFKEKHLSHVIKDCEIRTFFIHSQKSEIFERAKLPDEYFNLLIRMSSDMSFSVKEKGEERRLLLFAKNCEAGSKPSEESDLAAIIYSSGSTGMPKGIKVTNRIFSDSTIISTNVLKNTFEDRLLSLTPFSFDGALSQLFTAIYKGCSIVLQESVLPTDVVRTMLSNKITGIHAVPSFWRMMLQKHSPFPQYTYPDLRYVSIIGEVFPSTELMKLKEILATTDFYMMYGITEAFRSTCLPPEDFHRKANSVGKPLPGVTISIINESGEKCQSGEIGEIVHEGVFVSPGYWNNPSKTTKVFRDGKVFTGDRGRMDDEEYLYFAGRNDMMIKIMGYRACPEEIEECLRSITGVAEAVVVPTLDNGIVSGIKAVVVPGSSAQLTERQVQMHCRKHLPHYMVPTNIEFKEEITRTGTFKIDRSALT